MANILGTSTRTARLSSGSVFGSDPATFIWPVTLGELKQHAQILHDAEDPFLTDCIADATEYIETRGQVSLIHQRIRLAIDYWPAGQTIATPRGPLVSVQTVNYLNSAGVATTLASGWRADTMSNPGGIYFSDDISPETDKGEGVVWIDMTCGFGTTPASVPSQWRQLVKVIATHSYQRRELAAGGGFDESFERVIRNKLLAAGRQCRYV